MRDIALHDGERGFAFGEELHALDGAFVGAGDQRFLLQVLRVIRGYDGSAYLVVVEAALSGEQAMAGTGEIVKIARIGGLGAGGEGTDRDGDDCEQEPE